jgi:DNA-directed RNA polymerase specialized sigma subunit
MNISVDGKEVLTRHQVVEQLPNYMLRHVKAVYNGGLYLKEDVEVLKKHSTIRNTHYLKVRQKMYSKGLDKLPERDRAIMSQYIMGIKVKDILNQYGISRQRLHQIKIDTKNLSNS